MFAPGVDDCQRADIFSHALSAHGLKPEQMQAIIDYDSPADQKCSFTNPGELPLCSSKCKHEASEFPPRNLHDPFDEWVWQDRLAPLQAQFPEINWQRRLESPPSRPRPDMGLIPLMSLLRAQHTPWCVRHSWAIQVAELMADLSYRRVLDCMMGMREIYVDPSTMQIKLNEGWQVDGADPLWVVVVFLC